MSWASRPLALVSMFWALGVLTPPQICAQEAPEALEESEGRQRARALALEGIEHFEQERWSEAHERLSQAFELFPAPTVALLDAKALEKLGRLLEAHATFQRAARLSVDGDSPKPFRRAVSEAERESERIARLIPSLTIEVRGASPSHRLTVNGVSLPAEAWGRPRAFDPGSYTVVAKRGTSIERSEQLTLAAGDQVSLILTLPSEAQPAGAPPPAAVVSEQGSSALTWTALGVGAAGIATGIIAGLVMQNAQNSLDDACTPGCPTSSRETLHRFRTARTVSAVGYSAGAVGLGIGLWLLLDDAGADDAPVAGGVSYRKGSAELQLSGAF
ncbi:MAG TPA: tetratricopeptide repeat protein [Polyangiaceae bacterium]